LTTLPSDQTRERVSGILSFARFADDLARVIPDMPPRRIFTQVDLVPLAKNLAGDPRRL